MCILESILLGKGPGTDSEPPVHNDCDCDCKAPTVNLALTSYNQPDLNPSQFEQYDCKSAGGVIRLDSFPNESTSSEFPTKLAPTIISVLQLYATQ